MATDRKPITVEGHADGSGMKLPTFLVIGANKGGTSTLYHHLRQHPKVFMPTVKEPHFFTYFGDIPSEEPMLDEVTGTLKTVADYAHLFDDADPHHAIGEASTGYLYARNVPARVRDILPEVKLVAILRDPAERAWSAWQMMKRNGIETRSDAISTLTNDPGSRYVQGGLYGAALRRWLDWFPREQLRIYLLDDLADNANGVMADLFTFIGVHPIPIDDSRRVNAGPNGSPAPAELREWLVDYYRADTYIVEELLGRDLSHWRAA